MMSTHSLHGCGDCLVCAIKSRLRTGGDGNAGAAEKQVWNSGSILGNEWKRLGETSVGGCPLFEKELTEPACNRSYFRVEGTLLPGLLVACDLPHYSRR